MRGEAERVKEENGEINGSLADGECDQKKRSAPKRAPKTRKAAKADPSESLKVAADRIASLLCELSADSSLFVTESGEAPSRKLDTKALKEFSGVLKEMSAVMTELHGEDENEKHGGVLIEFSGEAAELGL